MSSRHFPIMILAAGASLIVGLALAGWCAGLRVNMTQSYPRGLWRIAPLDRAVAVGDLVFICPPDTVEFERAFERSYIRRGLCVGGLSPLIKSVAALAGQRVEIAERVSIDGKPLPHSDVQHMDAAGRTLSPFAGGVVPTGELYLHSDHPGSYDSRYFGPIPSSGVLGFARPVLTVHP